MVYLILVITKPSFLMTFGPIHLDACHHVGCCCLSKLHIILVENFTVMVKGISNICLIKIQVNSSLWISFTHNAFINSESPIKLSDTEGSVEMMILLLTFQEFQCAHVF